MFCKEPCPACSPPSQHSSQLGLSLCPRPVLWPCRVSASPAAFSPPLDVSLFPEILQRNLPWPYHFSRLECPPDILITSVILPGPWPTCLPIRASRPHWWLCPALQRRLHGPWYSPATNTEQAFTQCLQNESAVEEASFGCWKHPLLSASCVPGSVLVVGGGDISDSAALPPHPFPGEGLLFF